MKLFQSFSQYSGAAIGSAATDYLTFWLVLSLTGVPVLAQALARISGGILSFLINRKWSFRRDKPDLVLWDGGRFLALYGVSYALSIGLFLLLTKQSGYAPLTAKIISDSTCFIFNFFAMKHFVFRTAKAAGKDITVSSDKNAPV
ncbi:MAG: GtrA family protein [Rhodospirillales bacterium]